MPNLSDPIATTVAFKHALLAVRDKNLPEAYLAMLKAQCMAQGGVITSTRLAEVAEYENYNAANLNYGKLAARVAEYLHYTPPARADGTLMWWTALSYSIDGKTDPDTGHFQFVMRPELITALREMKWVKT